MKQTLKQWGANMPFYNLLQSWLREKRVIWAWKNSGCPVPPPHVIKQRILRQYAEKYKLNILIETGTYYGDMVQAMKSSFEKIYSIELSQMLFEKTQERFKTCNHIKIIHGDSGKKLGNIIKEINQPAIFWLDGHYSAGVTARGEQLTPIYQELEHILNSQVREHVILIDDARDFEMNPDYPTIDELKDFIKTKRDNVQITVEYDIIRVTPIHD